MSIVSNFTNRIRVLEILLTRRYIWDDLGLLAYPRHRVGDICGNVHPLKFANTLCGLNHSAPDFTRMLGAITDFEAADTPKWNSEPSVSEFLGELVFRLHPAAIVEFGCFVGWTSAHIALGMREAGGLSKLWCVDSDARFLDLAKQNLTRMNLDRHVTLIHGASTHPNVLVRLPSAIDVAFIDSSHAYETTREEIAVVAERLTPGGYIVLHDSIRWPGVRRAIAEVWERFDTTTFATEHSNGVTVLRSRK